MSHSIADLGIVCKECINAEGIAASPLPDSFADGALLAELYSDMVFARAFDAKAINLQRTGRLGTYASGLGQEAVNVGAGAAMRSEDVLLPSFREHALQLARGVTPGEILQFWSGDERGSDFAVPRQDFPVCITVGGHAPHAVGVAMALQLRSESRVAVCVLGDGATSKGEFYEALNAAGVWQLPLVFVVVNNQWAISTPRSKQSAAATLAQKAIAAGFAGVQVDGNDVVAVASSVNEALVAARSGKGPALIECLTYRLGDHTTVDDASRYRSDAEVQDAWKREPLLRLRKYLQHNHNWTATVEQQCIERANARVEAAVADFLELRLPVPADMFDSLYARLPEPLCAQRAALLARVGADD